LAEIDANRTKVKTTTHPVRRLPKRRNAQEAWTGFDLVPLGRPKYGKETAEKPNQKFDDSEMVAE
jgi:hypothetical protein